MYRIIQLDDKIRQNLKYNLYSLKDLIHQYLSCFPVRRCDKKCAHPPYPKPLLLQHRRIGWISDFPFEIVAGYILTLKIRN